MIATDHRVKDTLDIVGRSAHLTIPQDKRPIHCATRRINRALLVDQQGEHIPITTIQTSRAAGIAYPN